MDLWVRILMAANVLSYRLSNGRLGSTMAGQTVLLLNTVGRKSGKSYTTPINYFRDGDNYLLVASNWGQGSSPRLVPQPDAPTIDGYPGQGSKTSHPGQASCG